MIFFFIYILIGTIVSIISMAKDDDFDSALPAILVGWPLFFLGVLIFYSADKLRKYMEW